MVINIELEDILKLIGIILFVIITCFLVSFIEDFTTCYDYTTLDNEKGSFCLTNNKFNGCSSYFGSMRCEVDSKTFQVKEYTWYLKKIDK